MTQQGTISLVPGSGALCINTAGQLTICCDDDIPAGCGCFQYPGDGIFLVTSRMRRERFPAGDWPAGASGGLMLEPAAGRAPKLGNGDWSGVLPLITYESDADPNTYEAHIDIDCTDNGPDVAPIFAMTGQIIRQPAGTPIETFPTGRGEFVIEPLLEDLQSSASNNFMLFTTWPDFTWRPPPGGEVFPSPPCFPGGIAYLRRECQNLFRHQLGAFSLYQVNCGVASSQTASLTANSDAMDPAISPPISPRFQSGSGEVSAVVTDNNATSQLTCELYQLMTYSAPDSNWMWSLDSGLTSVGSGSASIALPGVVCDNSGQQSFPLYRYEIPKATGVPSAPTQVGTVTWDISFPSLPRYGLDS